MDFSSTDNDRVVPLQNNNTIGALRIDSADMKFVLDRYERDVFDATVIVGISAMGGIWTFVNGAFAAVFGATLILILFDKKPLSIYGLEHVLRKNNVSLHTTNGPTTRQFKPEEIQYVMAMLQNHLLDLDLDGDAHQRSESTSGLKRLSLPTMRLDRMDRKGSEEDMLKEEA